MSEGAAILRLIDSTPDDDAPRLVYADWLDEHDDAERAEFIRLECELARQTTWTQERRNQEERIGALWQKHARKWLGPFLLGDGQWESRRGFPEQLTWLGAAGPLQTYLSQMAEYDALEGTDLLPPGIFLRSLVFNRPEADFARVVAAWPGATRLRSLRFSGMANSNHSIRDDGFAALIQSPHFANLEELHLEWNALPNQCAQMLAHVTNFPALKRLNLCGSEVRWGALSSIARTQSWSHLEALDLFDTNDRGGWSVDCFSGLGMSGITWLNLGGNRSGNTGIDALSASMLVQQLRYLDYSGNQLNDEGARLLANTPWQQLEHLDLTHNDIDDAGAIALANSPFLGDLRKLIVRHNPIGERGTAALVKRFARAVLRM